MEDALVFLHLKKGDLWSRGKICDQRNLGRPTKLFVSGSDGVRQRLRRSSGIWEWVSVVITRTFRSKKQKRYKKCSSAVE